MPIREASIYGRPDHVLRVWQLREASGSYFLFGLDYRSGDPLNSCDIAFFDSERHLLLDTDGQIWLIPSGDFYYPGYFDRTQEVAKLMAQPKHKRDILPLTPKEQSEYNRLTSKK